MFKNKWITYQDMMDNVPMSVRVNTSYKNKKYLHTYSVTYTYGHNVELPDKNQLKRYMIMKIN